MEEMMERGAQIGREQKVLKRRAVELRQEATLAEQVVWELVRGKRLNGLKFRRQHVLHGHIIDFYCHELRLCIELAGAPHQEPGQKSKDAEPDRHLEMRGYTILRLENEAALRDLEAFRRSILAAVDSPASTVPPL